MHVGAALKFFHAVADCLVRQNSAAKDAMFPIKTLLWIWLIPVRSPAERNFVELNLLKAMEYTFQLKFLAAVVILANSISLPDIILLLFVIAVVTAYLPT